MAPRPGGPPIPKGPRSATRSALKAGFGKETAMVDAGGTIGFVQPFADLLKGAPCILMGDTALLAALEVPSEGT
jgi:hypothetical protein